MQNVIQCSFSTFSKVNPAAVMLEYNLQPVVTSFISIVLIIMMIMMMMIGMSRSQ